jgi:hypothetical protein
MIKHILTGLLLAYGASGLYAMDQKDGAPAAAAAGAGEKAKWWKSLPNPLSGLRILRDKAAQYATVAANSFYEFAREGRIQGIILQAEKQAEKVDPDRILADIEARQEQEAAQKAAADQEAVEKQNTILWQQILNTYTIPAEVGVKRHQGLPSEWEYRLPKAIVDNEIEMGYKPQNYYQNSSVTIYPEEPIHTSVGLYNRDLIEGPVLAANLAADYALYTKLKNIRIEHIYKQILADHEQFENLLVKTMTAVEGYTQQYSQKNIFKKLFTNYLGQVEQIMKPLTDYFNERLTCFKWNPLKPNSVFRKEILLPIIMRYGLEKAGDAVVDTYIKKVYLSDKMHMPAAFEDAYELRNGKREVAANAPTSLVSLAKWAFDYRAFARTLSMAPEQNGSRLAQLNKWCGLGLEKYRAFNWLMGPSVQKVGTVAGEIATLCLVAKTSDQNYQLQWTQYLIKNHAELIALLTKYRLAKNDITEKAEIKAQKIKAIELEIKNFISKGHAHKGIPWAPLTQWIYQRTMAENSMSFYASAPLTAFCAWKLGSHAYAWYQNNSREN